jgi:hypothetical protein
VNAEQNALALYRSSARKQLLAKQPGPNSRDLYAEVEVRKAGGGEMTSVVGTTCRIEVGGGIFPAGYAHEHTDEICEA